MRTAATKFRTVRHDSRGWRFVTLILLAAFTLQSYVVQTHIHGSAWSPGTGIIKVLAKTPVGGSPAKDRESDCPFCQAIIHAGAFFTPAAPILPVPVIWTTWLALAPAAAAVESATAHDWQSRAPPQH